MNLSPLRWLRAVVLGVLGLVLFAGFALLCSFVYLAPSLPTAENAQTAPLVITDRSGRLISQIGEERRIPITYAQIPTIVRDAVLAAEDDRFFQHHGIDWMGVTRAFVTNVVSADATGQGGSTITQQAARNMFLTLDQTARRKLSEVFVTYRMERDFSKEQILAIYLNVANFGHRSVGIAAAAETYYGKHLRELNVSQAATLVGLLPAPSKYNPIRNARSARVRRDYVLGRMLELGYIDEATKAAAENESVATREFAPLVDVEADYMAEMARAELVRMFGPTAVNKGYRITTTLDGRLQTAANNAVRINLLNYDRRHGYRGRLGKIKIPANATTSELDALMEKYESIGILLPAVVTKLGEKSADVHIRYSGTAKIDWADLSWAKAGAGKASEVVAVGDVILVVTDSHGAASLAQLPQAQSALVALDPIDGAIVALVGGFDFHRNKFNRAMQAKRQPGSGFKPFIYSAALDFGLTAATVENDAPFISDCSQGEECWNPENSGGTYAGPMRLREALVRSRNPVAARLLQDIGVETAINHAVKFGFRREALPPVNSLALGVLEARPIEVVTGYAVFANGGFKVDSYFISRIVDAKGKVVFEAKPKLACAECEEVPVAVTTGAEMPSSTEALAPQEPADPAVIAAAPLAPNIHDVDAPPALRELVRAQGSGRSLLPADRLAPRVVSAQNIWIMSDIMHDVCVRGTCQRSQELHRNDLSGKTGTSNGNRDNWFNGFNTRLVASVWVGFDDEKSLGAREEGSTTALPAWMIFMKEALKGVPESRMERPGGLIDLRVSTVTGKLADQNDPMAVFETFMVEHPPKAPEGGVGSAGAGSVEPVF